MWTSAQVLERCNTHTHTQSSTTNPPITASPVWKPPQLYLASLITQLCLCFLGSYSEILNISHIVGCGRGWHTDGWGVCLSSSSVGHSYSTLAPCYFRFGMGVRYMWSFLSWGLHAWRCWTLPHKLDPPALILSDVCLLIESLSVPHRFGYKIINIKNKI